jgi:hypothetical protein
MQFSCSLLYLVDFRQLVSDERCGRLEAAQIEEPITLNGRPNGLSISTHAAADGSKIRCRAFNKGTRAARLRVSALDRHDLTP